MRFISMLVLVLLLAPAAARADWGRPLVLSRSDRDTYTEGVAADAHDRAAVLLAQRERHGWTLQLRASDRGGRLGAPVRVASSRAGIEGAGLFAGADGDLVAGWLQLINGSRRPVVATGPRLADRQLLAPGPRSTQVMRMAADRRGDAVVAFWRYDQQAYSIYAAYRQAGGRFEQPQLLATGLVSNPAVAIDRAGAAMVAWTTRDGAHVAERPAGAAAFGPPATIATERPSSEPAVALEGGRAIVTWIEGAISGPRTVRVAERPTASAPFAAPVAIDAPDVRIPHWVTPVASLVGGQALVAWIQGAAHTTAHDRAALAMRSGDGPWQAPIVRGVHGPAHVYEVELLARAAGRPPILAMTTSHGFHLGQATATVRDDGTLAPNRPVPTGGGDAGLLPWLAQGGRHAWLATERVLGSSSHPRHQALLFRSG